LAIELDFEELPNSGIPSLYKFKSFDDKNYYKDLLNNFLWLSSRTELNDPFDAQIPMRYELCTDSQIKQKMFDLLPINIPEEYRKRIVEQKFEERKKNPKFFENKLNEAIDTTVGVCSFTKHLDNLLLWAHYAEKHSGFCLEYDAMKLNNNINEKFEKLEMRIFLLKVFYYSDFPIVNPCEHSMDEMYKMQFLTKSKDWEYEDEWRILCLDGHKRKDKNEPIEPECITNIYFGLNASEDNIKISVDILNKSNPGIGFYKAQKKKDAFGLEFEKLNF